MSKYCNDCGFEQKQLSVMRCSSCGGSSFDFNNEPRQSKQSQRDLAPDKKVHSSENHNHSTKVAIESARIVNGYGSVIQIVGLVLGVLTIIGGFVLAHQTGTGSWNWIGIIIGALEIATFAVQGALFRMLSNYVIARLETD